MSEIAGLAVLRATGAVVHMWAIRGRVLAMSDHPEVPSARSGAFSGTVWLQDDGRIAAVTSSRQRPPDGFAGAPVVDVGHSLVMPGLIDLHNHLAYNTLPLWTEPKQTTPFLHHNSWTRAATYSASTTWPAYALITACPAELLAFVETKAIIGGTTTIQGSPPMNRPRDGWLVRNVEDETFGTGDDDRIYASVLTDKPAALATRAQRMRRGSAFIYHCSEGQPGTVVAQEFVDAERAGCLQARFVAVHANAADPARFKAWRAHAGAIAWSPFSNLWLYGRTTDVPAAQREQITVCLGSDWAPSGTKHVLGEVKVARLVSDHLGWGLSDEQLVAMMTSSPGDVLARAWRRQLGRLQPKAIGDVLVLKAGARANPYAAVVGATERDVELVVVAGQARYGTPELMAQATTQPVTTISIAGQDRSLQLTHADTADGWQWPDVVARMEQVRADPKGEIEKAQTKLAAFAGRLDRDEAPLRLALDMPSGLGPVGGLPKDLDDVHVPALETLTHDADWLAGLVGKGFHGGLLDGLSRYYPA